MLRELCVEGGGAVGGGVLSVSCIKCFYELSTYVYISCDCMNILSFIENFLNLKTLKC